MSGVAHSRAPLSAAFAAPANAAKPKAKRPAPVSVRFDAEERTRLERDAAGMSLGGYIKSRVFDGDAPKRKTRGKAPLKDWEALGRVLGALGRSGIPDALERLAKGQDDSALTQACADIAAMRRDLVAALGLQPSS